MSRHAADCTCARCDPPSKIGCERQSIWLTLEHEERVSVQAGRPYYWTHERPEWRMGDLVGVKKNTREIDHPDIRGAKKTVTDGPLTVAIADVQELHPRQIDADTARSLGYQPLAAFWRAVLGLPKGEGKAIMLQPQIDAYDCTIWVTIWQVHVPDVPRHLARGGGPDGDGYTPGFGKLAGAGEAVPESYQGEITKAAQKANRELEAARRAERAVSNQKYRNGRSTRLRRRDGLA